jgi:hypothetical protein
MVYGYCYHQYFNHNFLFHYNWFVEIQCYEAEIHQYETDKSEVYYNGIDFYINIFFFVFTPILSIWACFLWCVLTLAALEILGFLFEHRILQMMNTKMYVYKRDDDIRDNWN